MNWYGHMRGMDKKKGFLKKFCKDIRVEEEEEEENKDFEIHGCRK